MIKVDIGIPQFLGPFLHSLQQVGLSGKYKFIFLYVLAEINSLVLLEKLRHFSVVSNLVLLYYEIFCHVILYTCQNRHDTLYEKWKVIDLLMQLRSVKIRYLHTGVLNESLYLLCRF
jgi:hypothetical protein